MRKLWLPIEVTPSSFSAGAIDRHAFAEAVRVADDHLRFAAAIADVLRVAADDYAGIDVVLPPDRHVPHDRHVIFQSGSASDADVGADHAKWPDLDVEVDFGAGVDDRVFSDVS